MQTETTIHPWADWQYAAASAVEAAAASIRQARPDLAVECPEAALEIVRKENTRG